MTLWALLIVLAVLFFQYFERQNSQVVRDFNYNKFLTAVSSDQVVKDSIVFHSTTGEIEGKLNEAGIKFLSNFNFRFNGNTDDKGFEVLREKGITPNYASSDNSMMASLLVNWLLPLVLLVAMFMIFMRQLQVGGGKAMAFGKSRARLLTENKNRVTFKDVAGVEEAKQDLREIVEFLREPKKFTKLGGRIPKGVLLVGHPGTG